MPGQVLIKKKSQASEQQFLEAVRKAGGTTLRIFQTRAMKAKGEPGIARVETSHSLAQVIQTLRTLPAVDYAQTNYVYLSQAQSNDPFFLEGLLWGVGGANYASTENTFGSGASLAWAEGWVGSKNVCVGVIDQGIQYDHPDLADNLWTNPLEIENKIDDDGNGYVDDMHGLNAIEDSGVIYDPNDPAGYVHGTLMAGIIGAVGGNGVGGVGVNWEVSLISGKFIGSSGYGTTLDAIQAIDYMTDLKMSRGVNLVVLNNSWSGGAYDPALLESIGRAAQAEILFVAAAGNDTVAINTDRVPVYPACYDTTSMAGYDAVISVTAIAQDGMKPAWANYGSRTIDLGAPGENILSTISGDGYGSGSGTSMGASYVSGAVALYAARFPGAKAASIKAALLASAQRTSSLVSQTVTGSRLDIPKFLATRPKGWAEAGDKPPTAPSGLTATALSHSQIKLAWVDQSKNETYFEISRYRGQPLVESEHTVTVAANLTTFTDTGLDAATPYYYTIKACNSAGGTLAPNWSATTTYPPPPPAAVQFVRVDETTRGNWVNCYGKEGYDILKYRIDPAYGSPSFMGDYGYYSWYDPDPVADSRALQAPDGTPRFVHCYYSFSSFSLDLEFNDTTFHQVAIYCVDWDTELRAQRIEIRDAYQGTVLDSRELNSFQGGKYLVWNIQGHVTFEFTYTGPKEKANAVISGIFFDAPDGTLAPPAAPSGLAVSPLPKRQIRLTWTDNSNNETGFQIECSNAPDHGFEAVDVVGPGTTSYVSEKLANNMTFYYRVRAINQVGESAESNLAWITVSK